MSEYRISTSLLLLILLFFSSEALAQGGRGGGGARASAGRSSAGRSKSSRPQVKAPSMSRAMPSKRPSVQRPSVQRPSVQRPSVQRPSVQRPSVQRPSVQRPSPNINKPSTSQRPTTLPGNVGGKRPNIPTNRPNFGGNNNRPNLPSTRPSPGNVRDFLDLPGNNTRPVNRPSFGGNNNRLDIGDKTNIGNKLGGNRINTGDININAGNSINLNRQNNINSIRNNWTNVNNRPFGNNHWVDPGFNNPRWHYHSNWNRYPSNWCWRPTTWATIGTWFTWTAWSQPIVYDYGTNVVYRDNYIYVNDQPTVTTEVYYQQAETIAKSAPPVADEAAIEWMPLGVFAIAEEGGADSGMMIQLAVSKEGIIAGTFYNQITESSRPLEGMVDRETQRAVWKFSDEKNEDVVMETGIDNLTKDDSTALVHFGPDKTQTWLMVRLPEPEEETEGSDR